jgi:hypothetical protein
LPPRLIYEGKEGQAQDCWLDNNFDPEPSFATFPTSWMNDELCKKWPLLIFARIESPQSSNQSRIGST